jgi:hypothetical protein
MDTATATGIQVVRLTYEKWGGRDFLIGSADEYRGLRAPHLKQLIAVLDGMHRRGLAVTLVPLTLPGARWRQMNGGRRDGRLWKDVRFQKQSARFWADLAGALNGHPGVAAFDLLNEPAPELEYGRTTFWTGSQAEWQRTVRGTAGDLNEFNTRIVEAIRTAAPRAPLVLECGLHATPWAMESLEPVRDSGVLYSFHMYEPYEYTTWRKHKGTLRYPGPVAIEDLLQKVETGAGWLARFFDPVRGWMSRHGVPPNRVVVGEFGCGRRSPGAGRYLQDLVRLFDVERWHWLFYSFREDTWDGMDYELGAGPPPEWYWGAAERGELSRTYRELYGAREGNPVWGALSARLKTGSPALR